MAQSITLTSTSDFTAVSLPTMENSNTLAATVLAQGMEAGTTQSSHSVPILTYLENTELGKAVKSIKENW